MHEVLAEYGGITRTRLFRYLTGDQAGPARGLYELAAEYPQRGGRSLRASLCIATARAFGASLADAVDTAASLELLHNAFLVHDDVEDDSDERRGKPTLHVMHGVPIAVNVGDALAVMSLRPLVENRRTLGLRVSLQILQETERMARESVEGQAMELAWRRDNAVDLDERDYLWMILKKTCWYTTIYPTRVGALIGSHDSVDLDQFMRFGFFLGAAFQIQDDLLNLIGDRRQYGKELNGDLWEGKRTVMLIDLLRKADRAERQRIRQILFVTRQQRKAPDVRWIRRLMDRYGCIEHGRRMAHGLAGAALHECGPLLSRLPGSRDKQFITALSRWVLERA